MRLFRRNLSQGKEAMINCSIAPARLRPSRRVRIWIIDQWPVYNKMPAINESMVKLSAMPIISSMVGSLRRRSGATAMPGQNKRKVMIIAGRIVVTIEA